MNAPDLPVWWLCADESLCAARLDARCASLRRRGERLSVIDSLGTGISNLSAAENILLPAAWHVAGADDLRPEVARWLASQGEPGELPDFLRARSSGLLPRERQRLAVARALQLDAGWVLVEDDLHAQPRWLDEWIRVLAAELPRARVEVVSARMPGAPSGWRVRLGAGEEVEA